MRAAPEASNDNACLQFEVPNRHQRLGINQPRFFCWQSLWHNKSRLAFFAAGFNKSVLKFK
jgi:hypothetical protein